MNQALKGNLRGKINPETLVYNNMIVFNLILSWFDRLTTNGLNQRFLRLKALTHKDQV
jgi:hypothetical protein